VSQLQTVDQKVGSVKALLTTHQAKIASHLGKSIDVNRFLAATMACVSKDANLAKCSEDSLWESIVRAAQVQLLPGPALGHAYLVPYKGECTFIIGYRGMIALATRCGARKAVARIVYEKDDFEITYGLDEKIVHKPHMGADRGDILGAYAVIALRSGEKIHEWMALEDLQKTQRAAATQKVWKAHFEEMSRKTVLRRLFKWMPVDPGHENLMEAAVVDEYQDAGVEPRAVAVEIKGDAPKELDDLLEEPEPEPEPDPVEVSIAEEVDTVRLPRIPWDDSADFGGYLLDVSKEAATMPEWIDDKPKSSKLSGSTWRELCAVDPDNDLRYIKLHKIHQFVVKEVTAGREGEVPEWARRATIAYAIAEAGGRG
jgi:recombination protein RecT